MVASGFLFSAYSFKLETHLSSVSAIEASVAWIKIPLFLWV